MMRTTVRLDDRLLREAKAVAARRGTTLTALIEEGLWDVLSRESRVAAPARRLPTWKSGGTLAGVDLSDNAAVREQMEFGD
jgi:predicted transcriptional regulator